MKLFDEIKELEDLLQKYCGAKIPSLVKEDSGWDYKGFTVDGENVLSVTYINQEDYDWGMEELEIIFDTHDWKGELEDMIEAVKKETAAKEKRFKQYMKLKKEFG